MFLEGASEVFFSACNPKPLSFWFIKWWGLINEFLCLYHPVCSLNSICETWCLVSKWDLFLSTPLEIHDVTSLLPNHTFPWLVSLELRFSRSQHWLFILCLLWNMFAHCTSPVEHTGISENINFQQVSLCEGLNLTSHGCRGYRCTSLSHSWRLLRNLAWLLPGVKQQRSGYAMRPVRQRGSEDQALSDSRGM